MIIKFNYFNEKENKYVHYSELKDSLKKSDDVSLTIHHETGELMIYDKGVLCKPLAYAGITDKNGREIFEGDILSVPVFEDQTQTQIAENTNEAVTYKLSSFFLGHFPMGQDYEWISKYTEVVGNVFENSNILSFVTEGEN